MLFETNKDKGRAGLIGWTYETIKQQSNGGPGRD